MEQIQPLIEQIYKQIVNSPDAVQIRAIEGDQNTILQLRVDRDDLKFVIGKKGRTADAVRIILSAFSAKAQHRYTLEILEYE